MIARLRGTLLTREPDGVEIATPGGVVYRVEVPHTVLQRIPSPPREGFELCTLQVVREDSVTLYGFLDEEERELFRRLMSTTGVGAKLALAMLSAYSARRLVRALAEKDVGALKHVSGVGKKTAERLVLELADKVTDLAASAPADGVPVGKAARDAVAALVALGYSFTRADEAVRAVAAEDEEASTDEIIRKALRER